MRKLVFCLLVAGLTPAVAGAQTLRDQILTNGVSEEIVVVEHPALSVREMSASASAVVRVSVSGSETFLTTDGMAILTDYQVTVVDVVKSSAGLPLAQGDSINVRRLGGAMTIEGRRVHSSESGFAAGATRPQEYQEHALVRAPRRIALRVPRAPGHGDRHVELERRETPVPSQPVRRGSEREGSGRRPERAEIKGSKRVQKGFKMNPF